MPPEIDTANEDLHPIDAAIIEGAENDREAANDADPDADTSSPEAAKVAALMGWKAKKDWKGDLSNWRPAEDFLAEVPDVLKNTRKKAERLEGQVTRIVAQVAKLDQRSTAQQMATAKAAAREAFDAGDFDKAEEILTSVNRGGTSNPDEPQALTDFKARNDWFGVDDEATAYTAALDQQYAKGGITDPDAHMRKVEAGVKKRFPELFGDGKDADPKGDPKPKPPLVNRSNMGERRRSNGEMTVADMSPAQQRAAKEMQVTPADWVKSFNQLNKQGA